MSQEAITEVDMDVFSRRIGPYFSWLESKIESGWEQSDAVDKDILKESRYLATTMRARFILGLSRDDFVKEISRTLQLFELACDAFPGEHEEITSKLEHFCKGISGEFGMTLLPEQYRTTPEPVPVVVPEQPAIQTPKQVVETPVHVAPLKSKIVIEKIKAKPVVQVKKMTPAKKIEKAPLKTVSKAKISTKITDKKIVKKTMIESKPVRKQLTKPVAVASSKKSESSLRKFARKFLYGFQ